MVCPVGVEPTLLAEPDFKSGAATNYAMDSYPGSGLRPRTLFRELDFESSASTNSTTPRKFGGLKESRTLTTQGYWFLRPARLPLRH